MRLALSKSRQHTMPEESTPRSFAGFKFARTSTLRPCISSLGTNLTRPDTICTGEGHPFT